MKKTITSAILSIILSGCTLTNDYTKCPQGGVYHEHDWQMTPDYNNDGWFEESCTNCGLERRSNEHTKHISMDGIVYQYRNPDTGQYSDYVVQYWDENGNVRQKHVNRTELKGPLKY